MPVSSDQLRRITDLAVALSAVRDYAEIAQAGADALNDLVSSDGATVTFTPIPLPQKVFTTGRMPWAHPKDTAYRPALAHEDPVYQRRLRRLIDRPAHVGEFATPREMQRTALYNEVWRPQGIHSHLSAMNPCKYWFSLALTRSGITPFTSLDVTLVDSVRRLLESSIETLVRRHDERIPVEGELYEVQTNHWLIADAAGKILRADKQALVYLDDMFPDAGTHRLGCRVPDRYLRVYRQRLAGGPREPHTHLAPTETITAHAAPIHGCDTEFSVFFVAERRRVLNPETEINARYARNGGRALLALNSPFSLTKLRRAGLTPKETEVLDWMRQGKTNPEIAIILGSSPLTVKKHVENVYRKLCVETRVAAVMRAMELSRADHREANTALPM